MHVPLTHRAPWVPRRARAVYYCDSERHILVYGIGRDGPTSLRVVWLEDGVAAGTTVFHSYDMIGGYPALFSRGHIVSLVLRGFTAQHWAIRERVHDLERLRRS
jgi:hypothetical protein